MVYPEPEVTAQYDAIEDPAERFKFVRLNRDKFTWDFELRSGGGSLPVSGSTAFEENLGSWEHLL